MRGAGQEVAHTASRRSGPRRWLRAVVWLVAADLHPRAGATTVRVAEDLARRMDYSTGHVRYCLEDTAASLGVDVSTVKRHVAVLRELGALAWVVHGSRLNIRRALGLKGYAGTATVYAAVIPPVYDEAMGHRIVGAGYGARVVVDLRHRDPVDNPNPSCGGAPCAPPSLYVVEGDEAEVEVVGGGTTPRAGATCPTASPASSTTKSRPARARRDNKRTDKGEAARRGALRVAQDCRIAARVRPLVTWTQHESLRRLAFALRPLIDAGLDARAIAAELASWWLDWRPQRPAAYIRAQLAEQADQASAVAASVAPADNAAMRAWAAARAAQQTQSDAGGPARCGEDRRLAREYAWHDPRLVADHIAEHGLDDALDLYGTRLVALAERHTAAGTHFHARW